VVEVLPGSTGYYLEILAPWLRNQGLYIAADRSAANVVRDVYRHPAETLAFFEV
jgi:predicted methyltransferase